MSDVQKELREDRALQGRAEDREAHRPISTGDLLENMRAAVLLAQVRDLLRRVRDGEITQEEADEQTRGFSERIGQLHG